MARIPQNFIDDLLDRVDIVEVIDRRVKLKKTGKNFSACCPFHDEKTPSFSVNPDKQFFYCFGCGAGGNALGFVMDYDRIEFPEAVESLARDVGLEVPKEDKPTGGSPAKDSNKPLLEILERSARFYEHSLRKHSEAQRAVTYLKQRGLSGQIAKAFRLGFAPPGWDNLMRSCGSNEPDQARLMQGGMLVKNDRDRTYDRFRDRIMFPILDAKGRVIAFGGRVLGDEKPKYLNSPETAVFHKSRELYGLYQARKSNRSLERIVVVEGYMDVIALAQHGISYAVATLGTATSETHLEKLYRHVSEVVFCFDGDEAGRKAAFRALESALTAMQDGRVARFLFLPEGEDPDTLVRTQGAEHLEHLFSTAPPLEHYLFEHLSAGLDMSLAASKARFSKVAAPFLHKLPEGVFKALMFKDLATRTGIDVQSLMRLQTPPADARTDASSPSVSTPAPRNGKHGAARQSSPLDGAATANFDNEAPSEYYDSEGLATTYGDEQQPPPGWVQMEEQAVPADYEQHLGGSGPNDADDTLYPDFLEPAEGMDRSLSYSSDNPIHRLLGLLVLTPELARSVDVTHLPATTQADGQLLRDFIDQIQSEQDTSTAALLGYWYGTPQGKLLSELASREPLEDDQGREALFAALLDRLVKRERLASIEQRLAYLKAQPWESLSADEKQEYSQLLMRQREVSGKP